MCLPGRLQNSGELLGIGSSDARQAPGIGMELHFEARKLLRICHLNLRIQRFFYHLVIERAWQRLFGRGDAGGGIGHTAESAMKVLVQEIPAKLRIEYLCGEDGKRQEQKNRHDPDEKIYNDQAVTQAPQQAIAPPGDAAKCEIPGAEQPGKLREAEQ